MSSFCHLHCHTQYSLLDGAAKIENLISKAKEYGMPALAITDHGNMFGVPRFVATAKREGIKPIIGCEFYVAHDRHDRQNKKRYHQILLAKNELGYRHLMKLCSIGFVEGHYYKPRIDKEIIQQYSEGLIATTCCLGSEVSRAILELGEKEAEKIFLTWLGIFGEDYYIELQRQGIDDQNICNEVLLRWAKKHQVKVMATNDVHYVEQQDSVAQDILLCLQTGKDYDDPNRMRFENNQFFLKSPQEMKALFEDVPEAIENTLEIVAKIETPSLERDILLPIYQLPEGFLDQNTYLKHLSYEGAKTIYGTINETLQNRIDYELGVIRTMGFAGYFLIVQDFISAAKAMEVVVGPGRGSVAGSVIAYCLGITDIDPIRYNLLFERFLNPARVSMPDMDIDFDDEGRQKVIDYVVNKYGKNQVAQIITFGSMAAKSSIRDVARVLGVPLRKADYLAKLVPDRPGTTLAKAFQEVPELAALKKEITSDEGRVLALAQTLEGSARHTGIHAAGIIIAPDDITQYIPVKTDKDADLLVTQYDGSVVESVGMLKMDFLGLKTLSIIKDTVASVEKKYDVKIDITKIPLDDEKVFELFQRGDTVAVFQFESEGMRQWLTQLKPTDIEDLIAMNALYRPGPMQFIPNFVARKHGKEKVTYPHPLLEVLLESTYGIMVYQEQIMETARIIADYTLGEADLLRRAMGKKKAEEMAKQRARFIEGAQIKHKIEEKKAIEIFEMMEKFAQYGFNRSHSAAYSMIAYQTAYLKAHYPSEYMAAVLTHNQHDIGKISFFMEECRHQNLEVLGPDINESSFMFDVNKAQQIRFGLGAIKGTGEAAVEAIIVEREENGKFKDLFDFVTRVNLRKVNKKTLESLAMSGALDAFEGYHRRQYLFAEAGEQSLIEKAILYGNKLQREKEIAQQSLFEMEAEEGYITLPKIAECEPYPALEKLKLEKEIIGFYISGHPLEQFKVELESFCNTNTKQALTVKNKEVFLAGIVTSCVVKQGKTGKPFGLFTMEDQAGTLDMALFGEDFLKHQHLLYQGAFLYIGGRVQPRYKREDMLEVKPHTIQLLSEIREKLSKELHMVIPADAVDQSFIDTFQQALSTYPGKCNLQLTILSSADQFQVKSFSRKYRIDPVNEFFQAIRPLKSLRYEIVR